MEHDPVPTTVDRTARAVVDAAFTVHTALGPGLLERAYSKALEHELLTRGHAVAVEAEMPIAYGDVQLRAGFRADLVVDGRVIVELKAVERVHRVHVAQILTYLKLSGLRVGLLLNFKVSAMRDGVRRFVL